MRDLITLTCLSALCAAVAADGLSEYASQDFGRVFRPSLDLKMVESRGSPFVHGGQRKQSHRQTGQAVYGKPIYQDQPIYQGRPTGTRVYHKKFKPSPEDPFFKPVDHPYAPSHKYFHKYAQQLYNTQKNVGHLSEYQKYIINQDPEVKKFVYAQTRAPKQILVEEKAVRKSTTVRPATTTTEKVKVEGKVLSKKEQVLDNAAQSTTYKFVFKPEYVPVYTHDAGQYSLYEHVTPLSTAGYLTPTYAPALQYSLGDIASYKVPETGDKSEEDNHAYPTKEPKYEFKYEVKDHEKHSNYGHTEARKGKMTWGKYYVQLSDGRLETVKYWADKTGYHAEVDFKGQARHPPTKPKEHPLAYAGEDLKLYAQANFTPQLYAVSEPTPVTYN